MTENGIPICDFSIFNRRRKKLSPLERFRRAVNYIVVLNKLNFKGHRSFLLGDHRRKTSEGFGEFMNRESS